MRQLDLPTVNGDFLFKRGGGKTYITFNCDFIIKKFEILSLDK